MGKAERRRRPSLRERSVRVMHLGISASKKTESQVDMKKAKRMTYPYVCLSVCPGL